MPTNTYKCKECEFQEEYIESISTNKDSWHPDNCPKCGLENGLEKKFVGCSWDIDVPGGYDYEYGKKAWKKNLSVSDRAKVLAGQKDPY